MLNEALSRVSRVLNDPPPSVVLNEFGNSSITFTLYYWHASDVPSELAARHDVILAVHRALASAGITIAFPQVVVWSGERSDSGPYEHEPAEVYTAHPGLDAAVARRRRTLRPQLKTSGVDQARQCRLVPVVDISWPRRHRRGSQIDASGAQPHLNRCHAVELGLGDAETEDGADETNEDHHQQPYRLALA